MVYGDVEAEGCHVDGLWGGHCCCGLVLAWFWFGLGLVWFDLVGLVVCRREEGSGWIDLLCGKEGGRVGKEGGRRGKRERREGGKKGVVLV